MHTRTLTFYKQCRSQLSLSRSHVSMRLCIYHLKNGTRRLVIIQLNIDECFERREKKPNVILLYARARYAQLRTRIERMSMNSASVNVSLISREQEYKDSISLMVELRTLHQRVHLKAPYRHIIHRFIRTRVLDKMMQ